MGVLKHCRGIRKWCQYEFFYSTMDRAYFMENEFLSCLKLLKLDQLVPLSSKELDSVPSVKKQKLLTRSEWNAVKHLICREIGRPRRFSPNFLAAEREKLSRYRYMVRFIQNYKHNPEVVTKESQAIVDIIKSFPYNIASPCNVGDCVTVFCKDTDQLQRGQILMVLSSSSDTKESNKHNNCASQKDGINNLQEEGDTSNDINSTNDTEQSNTTLIDKKYYRVQFEQSNVQDSLFEDYDICIHGK